MLKSWRSLLRCELATCVCFVHAYTCVCVCVYVRMCVRACMPVCVRACLCGFQIMFRGHGLGWAPGSFLQLPNIESVLSTALLTAPLVTKTGMPRQNFCLACLPSFRPGRWLRGSGQALSLIFYKTRSGVRPAAPLPAPPLPLTPQGCLICKSGSLCKFWGQGVRWAGLRALVGTKAWNMPNLGAAPHDWGFAKKRLGHMHHNTNYSR